MLFPCQMINRQISNRSRFCILVQIVIQSLGYCALTLGRQLIFCQTPVGADLIFSMLLFGADLIFANLPPGARRFFESEKRRDPSRAFMPVTK